MGFNVLRHTLAALFAVLTMATWSTAAVQVRVTPASLTATAASTVTLTVEADSVTDLGGFQFGFSYDPAKLQAVSSMINPAFDQTVVQNLGSGSGLIAATVFNNTPASGTPLTLATIDFTLLTATTSKISLNNVILGQVGGAEIPSSNSSTTIIADTFTIISSAGAGGSITPLGTAIINYGASQSYAITANSGYHITAVSVDGIPQGAISNYSFSAVNANHTISATFAPDPVNGVCGSSNGGTFTAMPATNLCNSGAQTSVTGSGPWSWSCGGLNGGTTASCSANMLIIADTTPPVVTTFTIPTTSISLTVPVTSLAATDATGVAAFLLSESGTQPSANDPNWMTAATPPNQHVFASQGTLTLFAFAKDAAGNISVPLSASVTITLPDTTPPTMTAFTIPAASTSLTVPVASLAATDATGVTAFLLSESGTQPAANDPNWVPATTPPNQHIFASQGTLTLYAFAKDGAGNISAPLSASVTITLPDTTPPVVTAFTMPAASNSMTVPLSLTAIDDIQVIGYLISEAAQQPQANDPNWTTVMPAQYVFTSQGIRTLFVFAKDAAGNISVPLQATVTITLPDTTPPVVTAFTIPADSTVLTVAIASLAANDDVLVTGYLLSETSTATLADPNWRTTPINSYTFASAGSKTLYAFARDAAGNISTPSAASVMITLPDTTSPVISQFSIPPTASSLTIPVTTFTATDDTAVTGYILTTSANAPAANSSGWTSTPPSAYTFSSAGDLTLYAFAKDGAGNISTPLAATVTITMPDTTAPVVAAFVVPASSSSLTVPVTLLTATDDVAVTGYFLSEVFSPPLPSASNWTAVAPASFTFSSVGNKTLYAFAKDAPGNISPPASASTVISMLTPQISWNAPAPITYGTPLSAVQLSATANVPGTFSYSPASGSLLAVGLQTLSVTFIPADSVNYTAATAAVAITVNLPSFMLTATASTGGAISPAGVTSVISGNNQAYTITPATGYHVADVKVDGVSQGAVSSYTFINVTAGHSIDATFAVDTFTITGTANSGGTITPAMATTLNYGASQSYSITPDAGFVLIDVKVDQVSVGKTSSYTFNNITAGHSIEAVFGADGVIDPANTTGLPEIGDTLIVLTAALGEATLTPAQIKKVDTAPIVNGVPRPDGKVDLLDVLIMLRRKVGLEKW